VSNTNPDHAFDRHTATFARMLITNLPLCPERLGRRNVQPSGATDTLCSGSRIDPRQQGGIKPHVDHGPGNIVGRRLT
jgi:hypothetical protein